MIDGTIKDNHYLLRPTWHADFMLSSHFIIVFENIPQMSFKKNIPQMRFLLFRTFQSKFLGKYGLKTLGTVTQLHDNLG